MRALASCLAMALMVSTVGGHEPRRGRGCAGTLQEVYLHVMRASAKRRPGPAEQVVPQLVVVYAALDRCDKLSAKQKRHMRAALEARMKFYRSRLLRHRFRTSEARRRPTRQTTGRNRKERPRLSGPADEARARQLIELIESTIAPESWQSRGGPGSIRYFPLLQALVVRQTGEVHRQVKDLLELVRN